MALAGRPYQFCRPVFVTQECFLAEVKLETNLTCSVVPSSAMGDRSRVCGFVRRTPGNHKETEISIKIGEIK